MDSKIPGLKLLRTGAGRTATAPTPGSRTQTRKAELKSYDLTERKRGRVKKVDNAGSQ
jgi:hypothetical protein